MYNTDFPNKADLPTMEKLVRSTIIASVSAVAILVTVVLPSEYGLDVTGFGRLTGLTTMGEIKMQLAQEAADEERLSAQMRAGLGPDTAFTPATSASSAELQQLAQRVAALEQLLVPAQPASVATAPLPTTTAPVEAVEPVAAAPQWRDEVTFTLTPMEGTEYKLVMAAGSVATYEFVVDGGVINFDAHGEGEGQSLTYEEGRGVASDSGQLVPPISGTHGWFFRNRGDQDVTVTLRTGGDYQELRKLI
ncbi:hypothetical protein IC608_06770 [Devosia sp. PTR5]|uniref:Transmembrane anchor protein n=1 Tax=Devosia oryzisoli TaxID=2774138 RepID=A0A927FTM6_9HYPH|nr:hypothetical protein [Devosia oryzisoli]MBD8065172.1 hypothetical protein [Devosia oryzisoli]